MLKRFFLLAILIAFQGLIFGSTANAAGKNVRFRWNSVADPSVTGYRVSYGFTANRYTVSFPLGLQTSFTLLNLRQGQTVYFVVQSENAAGLRSDPSAPLVFRVGARSALKPSTPVRRPPRVIVRPRKPSRVIRPRAPAPGTPVQLQLACAEWNTAFGNTAGGELMWNILRLKNLNTRASLSQKIFVRSSDGSYLFERQYILRRGEVRDVSLNSDLPSLQTGTVCLQTSAQLSPTLFQVFELRPGRTNFVLPLTFETARAGSQSLRWKTFHPSSGVSMTWASIVNPGPQPLSGVLTLMPTGSEQRPAQAISVPANGRVDIRIDDSFPRAEGEVLWTPDSGSNQAILRESRYFSSGATSWDAAVSFASTQFVAGVGGFLISESSTPPQVLELSNPLERDSNGTLQYLDRNGKLLLSLPFTLAARGGLDVLLNAVSAPKGSAQVLVFFADIPSPSAVVLEYNFSRQGKLEQISAVPETLAH